MDGGVILVPGPPTDAVGARRVDSTAMRLLPPLARLNLLHQKGRSLVALSGITFTVTLLFMQLGFFATVLRIAVIGYDAMDFDLLLSSPNYVVLTQTEAFPRARLYQAKSVADVESVRPLYVSRVQWRNPDTRYRPAVLMLGVDPANSVFPDDKNTELARQIAALAEPDTALVDRMSQPQCGPHLTGTVTEVGTRSVTVVGEFTLGPGFEAGLIVVSDQTFSRLLGDRPLAEVSLGLVKLRPGAEPEKVEQELRSRLPADVVVLTRQQVAWREWRYWVTNTSTGIIFGTGLLVAILFGVVITYQVLSLEVSQRLPEYATLKALGFSDRYLGGIVLRQALILGVASFAPGIGFALAIYHRIEAATHLPVAMTVERAVSVFALNLVVCALSGWMALRILRRADPVDLF